MSDSINVNTDNLKLLSELSWILENIASSYTGEAKSSISILKDELDSGTYPLNTNLIAMLDEVYGFLQEVKPTRAAQILSADIRQRWNDILK